MNDPVSAYFDKTEGDVRDIAFGLRALLDKEMPEATVKLAWGFPCWLSGERNRVASVIAHAGHCNLQLWQGAKLAGRWPGRIEGTGKDLRHVKVRSVTEIDDELLDIIRAAKSLDPHHVP